MKRPGQLQRIPDYFLDDASNPLFKDLPDEVYLSSAYERSDFEILDVLEVRELSFRDILRRVRADLDSPYSRWKSSTISEDWITRSATMLMRPFHAESSAAEIVRVRKLPLIPLQDGSWVSGASNSILYPDSDGTPVPTDLDLQLVDPQALNNPARKALFTELGVRNCVPKDVIALILDKYCPPLQSSVSHLRYLYWHLPKNNRNVPETVYLRDQDSRLVARLADDLYSRRIIFTKLSCFRCR